MDEHVARLWNEGRYTVFAFGPHTLKFMGPKCLVRYTEIKHWDAGYLVVTADYEDWGPTEEYIDLVPVLRDLRFEPREFLEPIREVVLGYDDFPYGIFSY
jgi:hypothetical protein